MTLDLDTTRRIRNLIPDTDAIFGPTADQYLFDDVAIEDFYTDGNSNIKWAAGLAKKTVGASEALILKIITNYETKTDGATLMKQWEAAGQALIDEGRDELGYDLANYFEIVTQDEPVYPEGYRTGWPY